MGTFDYLFRKPYAPAEAGATSTAYYDPVEILEVEDEQYEIIEADE